MGIDTTDTEQRMRATLMELMDVADEVTSKSAVTEHQAKAYLYAAAHLVTDAMRLLKP